jgi:hypothetical protein
LALNTGCLSAPGAITLKDGSLHRTLSILTLPDGFDGELRAPN